jgi:leucyl-tRNA synthetase
MSAEALKSTLSTLVLMLSPVSPHVCEELWAMLGHAGGLSTQKWPAFREDLTREEQLEVIVQINGRVRGKMLVESGLSDDELGERATSDPRIKELLRGKEIMKVIVIPNKLVNIVVK